MPPYSTVLVAPSDGVNTVGKALVPVSLNVAPLATDNVLPLTPAMAKVPLLKVPVCTDKLPATPEEVIAALNVTPLALVLLTAMLL